MSAHVLIENTLVYSTKWPRTHAWHCVARLESLKALAWVMGFVGASLSKPHVDHGNDPHTRNNAIYLCIYLSIVRLLVAT